MQYNTQQYNMKGFDIGVTRYFDWEGPKMENFMTLVWWRFSVTYFFKVRFRHT